MNSPKIQLHALADGGACAHKLIDGRVSAWWDKDGKLTDCERRDGRNRSRKPNAATRAHLVDIGPRMVVAAKVQS